MPPVLPVDIRRAWAAVIVTAVLLGAALTAPSALAQSSCGGVKDGYGRIHGIESWKVGCAKSRRVMRAYFRKAFRGECVSNGCNAWARGFYCGSQGRLEVKCVRGDRWIATFSSDGGDYRGVPAGPALARASSRYCGMMTAAGVRWSVSVQRGPVRCRTARRTLRRFYNGHGTPHGSGATGYTQLGKWRCDAGAGGGGCIRYGKTFRTARDFIVAEG